MRIPAFLALAVPLALAGCGRGAGNNVTNAANVVAQEGVEDLNSMVGGDELEPVPEASDDTLGNRSAAPPAPMPSNGAAPLR